MPQVIELLNKLSITQGAVNQVLNLVKEQHENIVLFYDNAIKQTRTEYQKLEGRLSVLYDDRLVGRITVSEYDKYVQSTKAEMEKLDTKLVELTNGNTSFVVTAEYLLELASKAKTLFESSQPAQKNKILRALLANLNLNQKRLQLNLLEPFKVLSNDTKNISWLRRLDSNQQPRS